MRIELGDCELRAYEPGDVTSLARAANNPRVAAQLRDRFPHPYTEADARAWIAVVTAQQPVTSFAIATPHAVIGGIGLEPQPDVHRHTAELGYWLAEPYWRRGIATRAVQAFTEQSFVEYSLVRIYAFVFETNPASARVLEKAGFQLEGRLRSSVIKHGEHLDQLLYARLRPAERR